MREIIGEYQLLKKNISVLIDKSGYKNIFIAEKIGLKKYIVDLPEGFNTYLYPAGKKMPLRIIQKVLLLRALINHPSLVMLEDPFNGIEGEVRAKIIDYLLFHTPQQ